MVPRSIRHILRLLLTGSVSRRSSQSAVRASVLGVSQDLEPRTMLSAPTMTAQEQLLLELVNRARNDPGAEAARFGIDLNDSLTAGTIEDTPKAPLAPHQSLITAAGWHSDDILNRDFFAHNAPAPAPHGTTPQDRGDAAGYTGAVGENIGINQTTGTLNENDQYWVEVRHENLFRSSGHRVNMLDDIYVEIGTGVRYGKYFSNGINWNAIVVTENFGTYFGNNLPFITGVVYSDATSGQYNDSFYSLGEGVGGGTITAYSTTSSATYSDDVGTSGGYSLQVPNGTYSVVLTLVGGTTYIVENVTVGGENQKVDFELTTATRGSVDPPVEQINPDVVEFNANTGRWNVGLLGTNGSSLTNEVWGDWGTSNNWEFPLVGDFNGDGYKDVAAWNSDNGMWNVGLNEGGTFVQSEWEYWNINSGWHFAVVGDFDGDGDDDIAGRKASGFWFIGESNGTSSFTTTNVGYWHVARTWEQPVVGDFNGDGRDDIAGRNDRGHWFVNETTGGNFRTTAWGYWNVNRIWDHIVVADFNNDGRDDLGGLTADRGHYFVGLSDGVDFVITAWGYYNNNQRLENAVVGDFAGDSRLDLAMWNSVNGRWILGTNIGGDFDINAKYTTWNANTSWSRATARNVDGAGRDELLLQTGDSYYASNFDSSSTTPTQIGDWFNPAGQSLGVAAFDTAAGSWFAAIIDHDANGNHVLSDLLPGSWNSSRNTFASVGDFNGDGLTDVAGWDPITGQWGVGVNQGDTLASQTWGSWNPASGWQDVLVGDFNGDGRDDIAGRRSSGYWSVLVSNGNSFSDTDWGGRWSNSRPWYDVQVGDFNGDGRDDIAGRNDVGAWFVALGSANGFTSTHFDTWSTARTWQHVKAADVNGDNRTDLVGLALDTGDIYVALSSGTAFSTSVWGSVPAMQSYGHGVVGNFSGDDAADFALWNAETGVWTVAASAGGHFDILNDFATINANGNWQQMIPADLDNDGFDELLLFGRGSSDGRWFESDLSEGEDPNRIGTWNAESRYTDAVIGRLNEWI